MYTEPETQSISGLVPARCYQYIFPETFDLRRISYYFDHKMANTVDDDIYEELFGRVGAWQAGWNSANRPFLKYRKAWHSIAIFDGRQPEVVTYSYHDDAAALYEYCAEARTPRDIETNFGNDAWTEEALNDFVSKDLMLALDGRYLSLALPENRNFDLKDVPERQSRQPASPSAELIAR